MNGHTYVTNKDVWAVFPVSPTSPSHIIRLREKQMMTIYSKKEKVWITLGLVGVLSIVYHLTSAMVGLVIIYLNSF